MRQFIYGELIVYFGHKELELACELGVFPEGLAGAGRKPGSFLLLSLPPLNLISPTLYLLVCSELESLKEDICGFQSFTLTPPMCP